MDVRGENLGQTRGSVSPTGVRDGTFFSEAVYPSNSVGSALKFVPYGCHGHICVVCIRFLL
jgi:hypothetical protein